MTYNVFGGTLSLPQSIMWVAWWPVQIWTIQVTYYYRHYHSLQYAIANFFTTDSSLHYRIHKKHIRQNGIYVVR